METPSFDQLLVFVTSVDEGSFSGAARRLNRAQSAITYAIQKLEDQVGAPLFDRTGYRPIPTRAGQALVPRARRILADVAQFGTQVKGMAGGLEYEVRLGLSEMVPFADVAAALSSFRAKFPAVGLKIFRKSFGLPDALQRGVLDLAVLVEPILPDTLESNRIAMTELVAVAAPDHPLARCAGPITVDVLRHELQIVLTESGEATEGKDHGVAAFDAWRVTDLATKRSLICASIGWGSMPRPLVEADIASGRLVVLPVDRWDGLDHLPSFEVVVSRNRDHPQGPASAFLFQALVDGRAYPDTNQ